MKCYGPVDFIQGLSFPCCLGHELKTWRCLEKEVSPTPYYKPYKVIYFHRK